MLALAVGLGECMSLTGDEEPQVGETLFAVDDLTVGDIVYFVRTEAAVVEAHAMTDDVLSIYAGRIFVLTDISDSGTTHFREVNRAELD